MCQNWNDYWYWIVLFCHCKARLTFRSLFAFVFLLVPVGGACTLFLGGHILSWNAGLLLIIQWYAECVCMCVCIKMTRWSWRWVMFSRPGGWHCYVSLQVGVSHTHMHAHTHFYIHTYTVPPHFMLTTSVCCQPSDRGSQLAKEQLSVCGATANTSTGAC